MRMAGITLLLVILLAVTILVVISIAWVGGRYGEVTGEGRVVYRWDDEQGKYVATEQVGSRVVEGRGEAGEDL